MKTSSKFARPLACLLAAGFVVSGFGPTRAVAAAEPDAGPNVGSDAVDAAADDYTGIWPLTDDATAEASVVANAATAASDAPFDPVQQALTYLTSNLDTLGMVADAQFVNPEPTVSATGGYVVRFDQTIDQIPVYAGDVAVRLDDAGGLLSISSNPGSSAPASLQPAIDAPTASAAAIADAVERLGSDGIATETLAASTPVLEIYDPSLIGGDPNADRFDAPLLVWDTTVSTPDGSAAQRALVDAATGEVVLSYEAHHSARRRIVCDVDNNVGRTLAGECVAGRAEGGPATGLADADAAYAQSGFFYDYFSKRFGRDGWDGKGSEFVMETRACIVENRCPMANAAWVGDPFNVVLIGEGWVQDDVIFHEWTHAVTESTANLMYYAESGAINESISDVFGELIDIAYNPSSGNGHDNPNDAWLLGEDLRTGGLRSMRNPPDTNDPDKMTSQYYTPSAGSTNPAQDNWGIHTNSGVNNKAAYLISEGGSFNGQTITGIGQAKTATLYYELLTGVLTPGSDYLDLYYALPKACDNLVKTNKLAKSDCDPVRKAVTATEMNKAQTQRLSAAQCPSGTPFDQYTANAEGAMNMVVGGTKVSPFRRSSRASVEGKYSYWLPSPLGTAGKQESWMRTRYPIYISKQDPAFLSFEHSYSFARNLQGDRPAATLAHVGGVIEYSTDGKKWQDLGSTADTVNGYSGKIVDRNNPLDGREAFTYQSKGFEQVRIPISFLQGKTVHFRWRYATNNEAAEETGWFVDDISVHTCGTAAPTDTKMNPGRFTPVAPRRVFDTRDNNGTLRQVSTARRTPKSVLEIDLTDLGVFRYGDQVTAVALNVTAVDADASGYVTAYPCSARTETSTVNIVPGIAAANSAIIPLAADGKVCFTTSLKVNILADITGYFSTTRSAAGTYRPIDPKRVFDTRTNSKTLMKLDLGKRTKGQVVKVPIKGFSLYEDGDTPVAVAVNVTTTQSDEDRYATAYPCSSGVPNTSTVNSVRNQSVTNSAIIPIDKNGDICVLVAGPTHVLMDITGYFTSGGSGYKFAAVTPKRVADTREGEPSANPKIVGARKAASTTEIPFGKLGIFGKRTPVAVAANFTSVDAAKSGYLSAWACGTTQPTTSMNNYEPGLLARASSALAEVGSGGDAGNTCVYSYKGVDVVVDITGYFY